MSKIILICGPTCTGKTDLSICLAQKLNAHIINADATYIYKEPLIATAKITPGEMKGVHHYMIDIISLGDNYSIYAYQKQARKILDSLIKENKNVIIIGGSGLYIKALLYDYELLDEANIKIDLSNYSNEELKSMADNIDESNDIHINNRQRLERFVSRYYKAGKTVKTNKNKPLYDFIAIALSAPRDILYEKINERVDKMFASGLLEETKKIKSLGFKNFTKIIGYKELNSYLNGEITLGEAKELIKKNTRHYAKRQLTWFNHQFEDIKWFNVNYSKFEITCNEVLNYIENKEME